MELPQIVITYIDTFCRQDLDAWLTTFAPDGTYSDRLSLLQQLGVIPVPSKAN